MRPELDVQIARIRAMSPDEKFRISHALWLEAREALAAGVRMRHPDWSLDEIAREVRELMRDAGP